MTKTSKPAILSAQAYRDILDRHSLRYKDAAWIAGVGVRQARAWGLAEYPIPQSAALLFIAFDRGRLSASWLAEHIGSEPPA